MEFSIKQLFMLLIQTLKYLIQIVQNYSLNQIMVEIQLLFVIEFQIYQDMDGLNQLDHLQSQYQEDSIYSIKRDMMDKEHLILLINQI